MKYKIAIVKFSGGLGNQMFQYTFLKWLELYGGFSKLYIDSKYGYGDSPSHYGFELNRVFNLKGKKNYFLNLCIRRTIGFKLNLVEKIICRLLPKVYRYEFYTLRFHIPKFDSSFKIVYFDGYWQSYKYILGDKPLFDFTTLYNDIIFNSKLLKKLSTIKNSVSIHIRGGDYISDPHTYKLLGSIVDEAYYLRAINEIKKRINNPSYIVFTDDFNYANKILSNAGINYFLSDEFENKTNYFLKLYFMSLCENNIIGNSTFALWGALLNNYVNKIVISPANWVNYLEYDIDDILPPNFIKL